VISRQSYKISGLSAGRNLFSYYGPFPLNIAQHVSVIFTMFNNVEVNGNRKLYFRQQIYYIIFSAFKVFGLSQYIASYFSMIDKLTHSYITYVCLLQSWTAFFAWISTSINFANAILISILTAYPVTVVFEFHFLCFKMSLCYSYYFSLSFIFCKLSVLCSMC